MDISLYRDPVGKSGGDSFTGDFDRRTKEALETERLSLRELCKGNLGRGSFAEYSEGYVQ